MSLVTSKSVTSRLVAIKLPVLMLPKEAVPATRKSLLTVRLLLTEAFKAITPEREEVAATVIPPVVTNRSPVDTVRSLVMVASYPDKRLAWTMVADAVPACMTTSPMSSVLAVISEVAKLPATVSPESKCASPTT